MDAAPRHCFQRGPDGAVCAVWREASGHVARWDGAGWADADGPMPAGDPVDAATVVAWLGLDDDPAAPRPRPRRRRLSTARLRTVFLSTFLAAVGTGAVLAAVGAVRVGPGPGEVPASSLLLGAALLAALVTFLVHRQRRVLDPLTRAGLAAIVQTTDARAAVVAWKAGQPVVVRVLCTDVELAEQQVRGLRTHERLVVPRDVL